MELTIYTEDFFDSAHFLENYEGKCSRLHGHTWKVSVWVKGDDANRDKSGILWDFGNIKEITESLDHKVLNEVLNESPSAEYLALYIYKELKLRNSNLKFKVRLYEKIYPKEAYCETGDF
ncbi:MAG TPA: 6-carboxytetrahydropterin synthase QueD [Spirochaetota bacterium]|nr:6-carboxytetrahydropterin synthase QueD [Spirochaetota bacterium]